MLSRTTTLVVLLQIIASLKIFDQVYLMTQGGPGTSTQVVLGLVTNTAFTDYRVGAASAASVLLFIVIVFIALVRQLFDRAPGRGRPDMATGNAIRRPPDTASPRPHRQRATTEAAATQPRLQRSSAVLLLGLFAMLWLIPSLWAIKTSFITQRQVGAGRRARS